ncbi:cupin domain-containing protein [Mycolicibacterium sp. BiH015]|uniref:cupin domain-containing protein n=1 Tax=Mycolicibacterium sp. BiH015 TaxID=3018808 RepID=UPI0022E7763D|nr:cupin domain-containing protein [Mycolicibacterium sp. BiH015]MDA2893258.1 cupin domain-containing protein [Mycolicibacterium sp. BiH015]
MARVVTTEEQQWASAHLAGFDVEECRLWDQDNMFAGIFKLPKGFVFPHHAHRNWVQIFVVSGQIRIDLDGQESRSISAGGYYFVEPGDPHVETVEEDLTALVITAEDRSALNDAFI